MKNLKMNFSKNNVPDKIQKARAIVLKMTGNTNFATPSPSLTTITTAIDKLESSHEAAMEGGKNRIAARKLEEKALDKLLKQLAAFVQDVSLGDEAKILSSGFELSNEKTPAQLPAAPHDVRTDAEGDGKVSLRWGPVKFARAYLLQMSDSPDDENSWVIVDGTTRARYLSEQLQSLSIKWFRVAALGTAGKGNWSSPAKVVVV